MVEANSAFRPLRLLGMNRQRDILGEVVFPHCGAREVLGL